MSCSASPRDHHPVRVRRRQLSETLLLPKTLPPFDIALAPPDLSEWERGKSGVRGVVRFDSNRAGPHVALVCLMHGNEYAGAIALDRLIREGIAPRSGVVSVVFANLDAFRRFDPAHPTASRFVDEDLNRVWDEARLRGNERSTELDRARELLPIIESADVLLDLHSMLWESDPLLIAPHTARSRRLANAIATQARTPRLVLNDLGHLGGARLIDHRRFTRQEGRARAMLLEAGQHWRNATVETSRRVVRTLLDDPRLDDSSDIDPLASDPPQQALVTDNVVARSAAFAFTHPYRGGDIIPDAGTVIARDGDDEICTPYDRCLLVMPNPHARRGQLAVRLARLLKGKG